MKQKFIFIILYIAAISVQSICFSQDKKSDSTVVYTDIKEYSKKSKFTSFVHGLLFRSPRKEQPKPKRFTSVYGAFEGKFIHTIAIETTKPFGYSIHNIEEVPDDFWEKAANSIHVKSKKMAIRNYVLFSTGKTFDSLQIIETERLLRSQKFVYRVSILPTLNATKDSVNIRIRVIDSWSIIPSGSINSDELSVSLNERNFLGLGHEFFNEYQTRFDDKARGYIGTYTIKNIRNTFTDIKLHYENDFTNQTKKSAQINRPFYSSLTQFAGGISWEQKSYHDSLVLPSQPTVKSNESLNYTSQNYWLGLQIPIFKGNSYNERSTNLVFTARYFNRTYTQIPNPIYDPTQYIANEELYIASIGLSTRKFAKDSFVFYYDRIEDIPYGKTISFTSGFKQKNHQNIPYYGAKIMYGDYVSFGYLFGKVEWGSFFKNNQSYEGALRIGFNYFSPLLSLGSLKMRQFVQPNYTLGIHRDSFFQDKIHLNTNTDIRGFTEQLKGTEKASLTLQSQFYFPKTWYGFHISPYLNFSFGMLGDKQNPVFQGKLYSKLGLGCMITNDYLVFNRFHISLAYYPTIPFKGDNVFKFNSFENNDYVITDFQIGEPSVVPFE